MAIIPKVIIAGRTNVGKSTLLNRLAGQRLAITSDTPGTTRDPVYTRAEWQGKPFELVDTAGLSPTRDVLEGLAQTRSQALLKEAAVIVLVVDGTVPATTEDIDLARRFQRLKLPLVLAINKVDYGTKSTADDYRRLGIGAQATISALSGRGTGDLLDLITAKFRRTKSAPPSTTLKLAIIGRPNVGKSSLFNALLSGSQAITSDVPGTTRDINITRLQYQGTQIELFDTAGLRSSGKQGARTVEKYSALRTVEAIEMSDVCVLVLDATEPAVHGDQTIAGMVKEAGKGLILALNKWDLADKDERAISRITARVQADFQFVWWAPMVYVSATTQQNVTKLVDLATEINNRASTKLPTPLLNRLVGEAVRSHPVVGHVRGTHPRISYVTQVGAKPPELALFVGKNDSIHFSYLRRLENVVRREFDLTGVPLRWQTRHKHADEAAKV